MHDLRIKVFVFVACYRSNVSTLERHFVSYYKHFAHSVKFENDVEQWAYITTEVRQ